MCVRVIYFNRFLEVWSLNHWPADNVRGDTCATEKHVSLLYIFPPARMWDFTSAACWKCRRTFCAGRTSSIRTPLPPMSVTLTALRRLCTIVYEPSRFVQRRSSAYARHGSCVRFRKATVTTTNLERFNLVATRINHLVMPYILR